MGHHVVNHSVTGIAINHQQNLSSIKFPISSSSTSSLSHASSMVNRVRPRSNDYYSWQSFDGKYDGTAYFYCRQYQGLFARQQQLILMEEQKTPRYVSPKALPSSTKRKKNTKKKMSKKSKKKPNNNTNKFENVSGTDSNTNSSKKRTKSDKKCQRKKNKSRSISPHHNRSKTKTIK